MKTTKELLEEKFAKKSNNIVYSTKIFENQPQISFHNFEEIKEDGTIEVIGVFILKYEINGIAQEAIIGKLKNTNRAFEKAREIKELIEKQLIENSKGEENLHNFRQLNRFVNENRLQFEFTMEGTDIITYSGEESIDVRRTYYEKENTSKNNCIECLYSPEKMEEFAKERKNNNMQLLNKFDMNEKCKRIRELILKRQETDADKKLFLEGEKISKIIEEADDENVLKNYKDVVADYITEKYQKYGNLTNEEEKEKATREFQEYVNLKEKGIAIDAKILLEEVQNKFEEKFIKQNDKEKVSEEEMFRQSRTMNTLYNYARFFDLIKNGRELNARIYAAKLVKIDFSMMKKIFNRFHKDEELLKYIDLKEKEIREMQDKTYVLSVSTYEDYNKDSVKELNSFLIRSSIREHTRKDDEEKILDTFDQMKVELIKHNIEALKKYKYYAEKNGLYTCSLPKEDDKKGEGKPIATTLQKMYEISDEEFEDVINPIIPDER